MSLMTNNGIYLPLRLYLEQSGKCLWCCLTIWSRYCFWISFSVKMAWWHCSPRWVIPILPFQPCHWQYASYEQYWGHAGTVDRHSIMPRRRWGSQQLQVFKEWQYSFRNKALHCCISILLQVNLDMFCRFIDSFFFLYGSQHSSFWVNRDCIIIESQPNKILIQVPEMSCKFAASGDCARFTTMSAEKSCNSWWHQSSYPASTTVTPSSPASPRWH